jgi:hypothetical protein
MNRKLLTAALLVGAPVVFLGVACGDDEVYRDQDAGKFDSGPTTEAGPAPDPDGGDGAPPSGCGNAAGSPLRMLLSMNVFSPESSEVAAFNFADKKVDGRFGFPGNLGASSSFGTDPYVVEQKADVVARMNAKRPWEAVSTWNVKGDDQFDGGSPNAQPISVIVPSCTKGYVLRFNRNKIAVIDTNKVADGGPVESYIDLAPLLQPDDKDGLVEVTSAYYVASKNRIYVLLGNYDRKRIATDGYTALCSDTKPSLVAIDATTGALVSLGGTAPGGGIALTGFNPALSAPMAYDAARDRLLVFQGGCNVDMGGGVAGPVVKRVVEEIDLATGQPKTLLTLNDKGFPGTMVLMDSNRAALTFFFPNQAFFWNPSSTVLGAEIPNSMDFAAHDGKGNLVGARRVEIDGGARIDLLSVPYNGADGGTLDAAVVQKLGENPFTINSGYLGGVEVWPRP